MRGNRNLSRILCALLAAAMLLSVAACKKDPPEEPTTTKAATTEPTTENTIVDVTHEEPTTLEEEPGTEAESEAGTTGKNTSSNTKKPTTTKKPVSTTLVPGVTRPYFSTSWTGNATENQQALEYTLNLIDMRTDWAALQRYPFEQAQAVADYVADSIRGQTGERMWTAYSGLVKKQGTCWAYANAYLFITKELGLNVKRVSVREGTIKAGKFDVFHYETNEPLGWIEFSKDHAGVELIYKGMSLYVETQLGQIFIVKGGNYCLLEKAPN